MLIYMNKGQVILAYRNNDLYHLWTLSGLCRGFGQFSLVRSQQILFVIPNTVILDESVPTRQQNGDENRDNLWQGALCQKQTTW